MALLGGWLCEVTYIPISYSPLLLKNYFTPIKGGAWPLVPLAIPVTVVQPGFVNELGAKARERSDRAGGGGKGRSFKICV